MANSIIGKWNYKLEFGGMSGINITYEFHNDGTYTYHNAVSGYTAKGEYQISGNRINYVTMGTSDEFSLDGDQLTLITQGQSGYYKRVD